VNPDLMALTSTQIAPPFPEAAMFDGDDEHFDPIEAPLYDAFRKYIMNQLRNLEGLGCQHIDGGVAIYQQGVFFAIVEGGKLFFKTDDHTAKPYLVRDMESFRPGEGLELLTYHRVPDDVIADDKRLVRWARRSLLVANRQQDQ